MHFLKLDSFQHEFGVGSPEARWALQHADTLVRRLLDTLATAGRLMLEAVGPRRLREVNPRYNRADVA